MPPNTDYAHKKHNWTIIRDFNQVQVITPWWWIQYDPKHVWVYLNVCLLDFYITQILTSTTVIVEGISWLMKVTDNNDARWKPEIDWTVCPLNTVRCHYLFTFCLGTHERIETYRKYCIYFGKNRACLRVSHNCAFIYWGYIAARTGMEPSLSSTGRGKPKNAKKKKPIPVPLCPPQIPHVWLWSPSGSPRRVACN
jgi:hypothetical protein